MPAKLTKKEMDLYLKKVVNRRIVLEPFSITKGEFILKMVLVFLIGFSIGCLAMYYLSVWLF